jgi:sirohydrochlorin ferrochelatase
MTALLIVAHGSRRVESNDEVRQLAKQLKVMTNRFDTVECAFLELESPSIPDGLNQLIHSGVKEIVVLPYFLSNGRHVASDIPSEIAGVRDLHSDVNITQAPYVGRSELLQQLLLDLVE